MMLANYRNRERKETMIESTITEFNDTLIRSQQKQQKVLRMKPHERMGGSVPVWEARDSAKDDIADNITNAARGMQNTSFEQALAYAQDSAKPRSENDPKEFGFGDLFDMVNPLQHIPLVNLVYREITGDEIRPASKIIGGAAYGGFGGAASALADTIIEYETGKSISGNVLAMVGTGKAPEFKSDKDHPENRLNQVVINSGERQALPASAHGFTGSSASERIVSQEKYMPAVNERTAGTMPHAYDKPAATAMEKPVRMPITRVALSPLPPQAHYND